MSKLITSLLLVLALGSVLCGAGKYPVDKVTPSTVVVGILLADGRGGHCTAFSVNEKDAIYFTAAHCFIDPDAWFLVGGNELSEVIEVDPAVSEVMVLKAVKGRPALKLGPKPRVGDEMAGFGYGMDLGFTFFGGQFLGEIEGLSFYNTNFMPGMSGGPITDLKGRLVGMVQCGGPYGTPYGQIGCGSSYDALKAIYERYAR